MNQFSSQLLDTYFAIQIQNAVGASVENRIPTFNDFPIVLRDIIAKYDIGSLVLPPNYSHGDIDPLWLRLERSAINQYSEGQATLSRYSIWATTVRDNIAEAIRSINGQDLENARELLIRAANSMSAFSELQDQMDPTSDFQRRLSVSRSQRPNWL